MMERRKGTRGRADELGTDRGKVRYKKIGYGKNLIKIFKGEERLTLL